MNWPRYFTVAWSRAILAKAGCGSLNSESVEPSGGTPMMTEFVSPSAIAFFVTMNDRARFERRAFAEGPSDASAIMSGTP